MSENNVCKKFREEQKPITIVEDGNTESILRQAEIDSRKKDGEKWGILTEDEEATLGHEI